jgi:ribonuclease R
MRILPPDHKQKLRFCAVFKPRKQFPHFSAGTAEQGLHQITMIEKIIKRYRKKDPHRERELQKYEHPVPSREFILEYLEKVVRPVSYRHLVQAFSLDEQEMEGMHRRLKAMERDGQIMRNRRGHYGSVEKMELIPGRVVGHRDGFGFVIADDGAGDIFLSARQMQMVFPGDRVLVRVSGVDARKRREGIIVEVLERNTQKIVGRFYEEKGVAFVDPDNKTFTQDIIIPPGHENNAKSGQFVVVDLLTQPNVKRQPVGTIVEILGDPVTPGMEVELAIRSHQLPFLWSTEVLAEIDGFSNVKVDAQTYPESRKDLRGKPFVTIDGEDAKDFDDAIYCEALPKGGWRLYVAIADVSHYVKPKTALDREAEKRGNSVYFPAKVIPMLPEVLSNELCSLKPKVDRLVMVCEMVLDAKGVLNRYQFYEAVIHSQARLTYTEVSALLTTQKESVHLNHLKSHLNTFHQLFESLHQQRQERGAVEFETVETKIIFDELGKIDKIVPVERGVSHRMIEEAMLLANISAAKFLEKNKVPTLYRIHGKPEEQKLTTLREFLKPFGLRLTGGMNPTPLDYSRLLERSKKRPDASLIQTMMLRSLPQAIYSPENVGHFGLAYETYAHFTSPIRRYPDLIVHRAIKHLLHNKKIKNFSYTEADMNLLGEHCSVTERRADGATRDATDWLKCEFMQNKQGQVFDGIIAEVTGFGVFVELKEIYVQGLLHITALSNDYYHYDTKAHLLKGKNSGKVYKLGDALRVLVARVNLDQRQIDFELADKEIRSTSPRKRFRKRRK